MGFFGKSKKKSNSTRNEGSYVPPDIEQNSDSSDDDMVVLDFSEDGTETQHASKQRQVSDSKASTNVKGKKTNNDTSKSASRSENAKAAQLQKEQISSDKKSSVQNKDDAKDADVSPASSEEFVHVPSIELEASKSSVLVNASSMDVQASKSKDILKTNRSDVQASKSEDYVEDVKSYDAPYVGSEMDSDWEAISDSGSVHFKNERLEQLRSRTEDGPQLLRLLIILAVIGMFATSVVVMFIQKEYVMGMISQGVITGCTFFLGSVILIAELHPDPKSCWFQLRTFVTRHLNILNLLWGRGAFCILAGILNCGHINIVTTASGGVLAFFGLLAFAIGLPPYMKIESARNTLDDSILYLDFCKYDEDKDGYINVEDFTRMVVDMDLDIDTCQTIREFQGMEKDKEGKVSFKAFKKWRVEEAWSYEKAGCIV